MFVFVLFRCCVCVDCFGLFVCRVLLLCDVVLLCLFVFLVCALLV